MRPGTKRRLKETEQRKIDTKVSRVLEAAKSKYKGIEGLEVKMRQVGTTGLVLSVIRPPTSDPDIQLAKGEVVGVSLLDQPVTIFSSGNADIVGALDRLLEKLR